MDAINVLMYFVVVTVLFLLLAIVQLLYHVSNLLTSVAIIKCFCYSMATKAKTNYIDSTRPAPLSMNELTTEY